MFISAAERMPAPNLADAAAAGAALYPYPAVFGQPLLGLTWPAGDIAAPGRA